MASKNLPSCLTRWERGQAIKLVNPTVTQDHQPVGAVVCIHDKNMKEAWFLATSDADIDTSEVISYYAMRWAIETGFRDTKDIRFGMGLSTVSTDNPERRDKLFLIAAIKTFFLTVLGAASEKVEMDRKLRSNTKHTKRMHSWFTQGCKLVDLIATMREKWLNPLITAFQELLFGKTKWLEILKT
jgi:hypothetical protein